jgi:uncharacterized repeat protein (TIGR04138 family)
MTTQMPPPANQPQFEKSLEEVIDDLGIYPVDAFAFLQEGLSFAVQRAHGEKARDSTAHRHVSGKQLCHALRELALHKWGRLARLVLERWGITCTMDFGRMVFAMVQANLMQKTDDDSLEDFRNVFDFECAFEQAYRISPTCGVST